MISSFSTTLIDNKTGKFSILLFSQRMKFGTLKSNKLLSIKTSCLLVKRYFFLNSRVLDNKVSSTFSRVERFINQAKTALGFSGEI
jgi:hypothetical protein